MKLRFYHPAVKVAERTHHINSYLFNGTARLGIPHERGRHMTDTNDLKQIAMDRRRMLKSIGLAGAVGVAGCTDNSGEGTEGSATDTEGGSDGTGTQTGTEADQSNAKQGGKLKLAQVKGPIEFDPIVLNDVPSAQVSGMVFEGLYTYGKGTKIIPQLAEGEPEVSEDGTTWTVNLNSNATFQNGDSVTAEDVKYSFEAPVKEETGNASEVNMIDSINAADESTVEFNLKYPYGAFLTTLTWSIVPKSVRENDKEAFNTSKPVGSGKFEFADWQEGQFAEVTKYEDYWGETAPNVDAIRFTPIEEATTRVTTLRNGENDVIEEIPPKLYSTVEGIQDADVQEVPGVGYFYLAFNCMEGPTTDPKVREAIDYCFSMDQAVKNYVEPTGIRQYSPLPKSIADQWEMPVDQWKQIPHDKNIEEAKKLFDEAGIDKGYQWKIIVPPDDKREQIGITVGNGLKEAGFSNVSVQRLDWGAFLEKYVSGDPNDYNMYTLGWSGSPDPDAFTYYLFGRTEDTLGVTNGTYWGENSQAGKDAAEKFVKARESADQAERKQLYQEGITTLLEERAHLPAYNLKNSFGVKNYVKDFIAHPVDSFQISTDHNNVWLDK
jgi:peptide/nickel transport system substrate-binding protein